MVHYRQHLSSLFKTPLRSIVVQLSGGLGNQVIQLAAGLYFRRITGRRLFLDVSWFERNRVHDGYVLHNLFDLSVLDVEETNWLSRFINAKKIKEDFGKTDLSRTVAGFPLFRTAYLVGYFLDYHMLNAVKAELRHGIQLPTDFIEKEKIRVFIHFRFGDKWNPEIKKLYDVIHEDYYQEAVNWCIEKFGVDRLIFYVFSDSEKEAREMVGALPRADYEFKSSTSSIADFLLMTRCRGAISANSSFSYCAALLQEEQQFWIMPWRWDNITADEECRIFGPQIVRLPVANGFKGRA